MHSIVHAYSVAELGEGPAWGAWSPHITFRPKMKPGVPRKTIFDVAASYLGVDERISHLLKDLKITI